MPDGDEARTSPPVEPVLVQEEIRKGGVGHNPFVPNVWLSGPAGAPQVQVDAPLSGSPASTATPQAAPSPSVANEGSPAPAE